MDPQVAFVSPMHSPENDERIPCDRIAALSDPPALV